MGDIIDFRKKKAERDKREEVKIYGNMLKNIKHLLPKDREDQNDPPPKAS
ncbi:MAG: hypothetical protein AAB496_00030 [Patescibacteria group bacterium]